jgi:metal-dependent amidase/aminoacylase/carboxypeptidase family protein
MSDNLSSVLLAIAARAVKTRRDLHRFPELDRIEFRTASIVAERLKALGLEIKLGCEVMGTASRMARLSSRSTSSQEPI